MNSDKRRTPFAIKAKVFMPLMLMIFTILFSCADGGSEDDPTPIPIPGYFLFDIDYSAATCGINEEETTPDGYFEPGTFVAASAIPSCGDIGFCGWHNEPGWGYDMETFVSGENPYVFVLTEDTYLCPHYCGGY